MAEHLSDEEQLEALKRWWKANGTNLLLAIVIAAGGWFGWNYWQDSKTGDAEETSIVYMAMLDAVNKWEQDGSEENAAKAASHAETLKKLGENGLYGIYGAMTIARLAVADNDLENAAGELNWALEHADDEALRGLARLRLATVEYSRNNLDSAIVLLESPYPEAFTPLYEELKGDIFSTRGDNAKASAAYRLALENLDENESRARAMLELKMNELVSAAEEPAVDEKEGT